MFPWENLFFSDKFDDFNKTIYNLVDKVTERNKIFVDLQRKCSEMQNKIDSLKFNICIMEQYNLTNNYMDITVILFSTNKSVVDNIMKLNSVEEFNTFPADLLKAFRINNRSKILHLIQIVVHFDHRLKKDELLNAVKINLKSNNRITAKDIYASFEKQSVYINYQSSINNKKLFWLAMKIGSRNNFKYVGATILMC